jgi:GWxTD domain-containing protein
MAVLMQAVLVSQPAQNSPFVLNLDYARFRNNMSSNYVEVYCGFYPRLVTVRQQADGFAGGISLFLQLSDVKTQEILRREHSLLPVSFADTSTIQTRTTIITQSGYMLPFGDYRLHALAVDSLAPSRRDSIDLTIVVRPYGNETALSDVELCSDIKSSEDKSNAFYKNSFEVVPNATLVFGVTGHPVTFYYAELYNLDPGMRYKVKTQVVDMTKKIVREATRSHQYGVKNAVDVGTVNVTSLGSGKYHFVLVVTDELDKEFCRTDRTFYIYNPHIQTAAVTPILLKANELAGLTQEELNQEFRRAQYFASDEDMTTFSKMTNLEGKREFLAGFWVEIEKGKQGRAPMKRSEYLQRTATANQRYGSAIREGWKTDRGRVFILYGDPDEIERVTSQNNAKPYETWHYYQIENGVQFVFIDRTGFSEYVLVHSTMRGELQDENWQRLLQ